MSKGKHLTLNDRINIQIELNEGHSFREIAAGLGKDPSTISKEIARAYTENADKRVQPMSTRVNECSP